MFCMVILMDRNFYVYRVPDGGAFLVFLPLSLRLRTYLYVWLSVLFAHIVSPLLNTSLFCHPVAHCVLITATDFHAFKSFPRPTFSSMLTTV
ncbi:hypothetical protein HOY80DRAFT_953313 [Tuber brumale]|nr:hypothetical protein HOY80DRAFT_953313 [Tuber brumale]